MRPPLVQNLEVGDPIRLDPSPVGKLAASGAANLKAQKLDRIVGQSTGVSPLAVTR